MRVRVRVRVRVSVRVRGRGRAKVRVRVRVRAKVSPNPYPNPNAKPDLALAPLARSIIVPGVLVGRHSTSRRSACLVRAGVGGRVGGRVRVRVGVGVGVRVRVREVEAYIAVPGRPLLRRPGRAPRHLGLARYGRGVGEIWAR